MLRTDPASDESCQGRGHAEMSIAFKEPSPFVRATIVAPPTTPTVAKTGQLALLTISGASRPRFAERIIAERQQQPKSSKI